MTTDSTNSTAAAGTTTFADALAAFDDALAFHEANELEMPEAIRSASDDAVDTAAWRVIEMPAVNLRELVSKFAVIERDGLVGVEPGPDDLPAYRRIAEAVRRDLDVICPR